MSDPWAPSSCFHREMWSIPISAGQTLIKLAGVVRSGRGFRLIFKELELRVRLWKCMWKWDTEVGHEARYGNVGETCPFMEGRNFYVLGYRWDHAHIWKYRQKWVEEGSDHFFLTRITVNYIIVCFENRWEPDRWDSQGCTKFCSFSVVYLFVIKWNKNNLTSGQDFKLSFITFTSQFLFIKVLFINKLHHLERSHIKINEFLLVFPLKRKWI